MKSFVIRTDVQSARGFQLWSVAAESEGDALQKFKNGEGDCIDEEIEVTSIGDPEIVDAWDTQ